MTIGSYSDASTEAEFLHDAGLNVFVLPRGSDHPFRGAPLGRLHTTRISKQSLRRLMDGITQKQPDGTMPSDGFNVDAFNVDAFNVDAFNVDAFNVGAFVGRQSGNLFVIDCTTPSLFAWVGEGLTSTGIIPWIRDGACGGQYWMRCRQGVVANRALPGTMGRAEGKVLGDDHYVLAPPSVDGRTGMVFAWTERTGAAPPKVDLRQLTFLGIQLRYAAASPARPAGELPPAAHRILIEWDASGYGNDDRRAEYAAALSLVSCGYSDDDILSLFQEHAAPHASGKSEAWLRQYVLAPARDFARHSGPAGQSLSHGAVPTEDTSAPTLALQCRHWAQSRPWPGRTGGTDRMVYLALCLRTEIAAQAPARASVREVAEGAAITKMTALRSLGRLQADGLITREGKDPVSGAHCYRLVGHAPTQEGHEAVSEVSPSSGFCEDQGASSQPMSSQNLVSDTLSFDLLSNSVSLNQQMEDGMVIMVSQQRPHQEGDAWVRSTLGLSARQVHDVLRQSGAMTVGGLHEATGRCPETVRYALKRLELHGLATRDRSRRLWCGLPASPEVLAEVAARLGSAGRCADRRAGHQQEREQYTARGFARAQGLGRI